MLFSGMLHRLALVRTGVSEEQSAFIISMTRIPELGTTLAVTSRLRFLQETHGVTYQKTTFFIDKAVSEVCFK
jgi:hypothetical protein